MKKKKKSAILSCVKNVWWSDECMMIMLSCWACLSIFALFSSVYWFTYVIVSLKDETIIIQWFFFSNNEFMLESEWLCFSLMFQSRFEDFYKFQNIFHIFTWYSLIIWSAMKLICTWCWLQIYCLATVKSRNYQKFEWYQDAAWWWSAVHWLHAEFSRSRRLW